MDALARLQRLGAVKAGQLSVLSGAGTDNTGATILPGQVNITGVLTNNVFGSLYMRIYDESSVYNNITPVIGNPLPAAFSSRPVGAIQIRSLNYANAVFNGYTGSYSVRIFGYVKPPTDNTYTFRATAQDGVIMYIGLDKIVSSWTYVSSPTVLTNTTVLTGGAWVPFMIEHATSSLKEKLLIEYSTDNTTFTTLTHGTLSNSFQFSFDGTEVGPTQMGTSYVSGKTFASDIAYFNKGVYLPNSSGFTGRTSELLNDYEFLTGLASITSIATLSAGSLSSTFSSVTQGYTGTLSVGTIINFSAGGSLGTNLALTGTLTSSSLSSLYGSQTIAYASTLSVGSLSAVVGTVSTLTVGSQSGVYGSLTQAYTSTLSYGTILNLNISQGTNFSLTGTLSAGSISSPFGSHTVAYSSTLSAGSLTTAIGNVSTMTYGSQSGTFSSITQVYASTLSYGTILNLNFSQGTNLTLTGTLTASSLSSTFGSVTQAYTSTLSYGTILNLSISQGTNYALTGTLSASSIASVYASNTTAYSSTLSVASLTTGIGNASTMTIGSQSGTYSSVTQVYASTLSFGTILNLNFSQGTNLTLSGTLTAGSIASTFGSHTVGYVSTLSAGSLISTLGTFATVSSGSQSSIFSSITQAYASTLSFGTILGLNFSQGTNLTLTGTLSAGSVTSTYGSQTFGYASTMSTGSLISTLGSFATVSSGSQSSTFGSITQAYASTLSFGTILGLNFSQGTNLTLTGTLTAGSIASTFGSHTVGYVSTLSAGSVMGVLGNFATLSTGSLSATLGTFSTLSMGSQSGLFSSVTQAYTSTLSVGTILNFSAGGSIGTNLTLSGTLNAMIGSISTLTVGSLYATFLQTATISASTYLNVVFNQSISSSGTTSSTYQTGTLAVSGGGSFSGTVSANCFTVNQTSPQYALDIAGGARVTGSLTVGATNPFVIVPGAISTTSGTVSSANAVLFDILGAGTVSFSDTVSVWTNLGIGNTKPIYPLDVTGAARLTGSLTIDSSGPCINVTTSNPGDMVVKSYTNPMDRYGFGQYLSAGLATTRLFTSGFFGGAGLALSIAGTGSGAAGIFTDVLTVRGTAGAGTLSTMGNVGINNTAPSYSLDVSGAARVSGSLTVITSAGPAMSLYTSTNNTRLNIDAPNAFQSGISFQSAGAETAVCYRVANSSDQRMYLNVAGDLMTWTNTNPGRVGINNTAPSFALDVNGSTRVTGSLMAANPTGIAPASTLTSNTSLLNNIVSASSIYDPAYDAYNALSFTSTGFWASAGNRYSTTTGVYTGSTTTLVSSNIATGEWIQLQMPLTLVTSYNLTSYNVAWCPFSWLLAGSNDNVTWSLLDTRSNFTFLNNTTPITFSFLSQTPYTRYRLIITAMPANNGQGLVYLKQLNFNTQSFFTTSNTTGSSAITNDLTVGNIAATGSMKSLYLNTGLAASSLSDATLDFTSGRDFVNRKLTGSRVLAELNVGLAFASGTSTLSTVWSGSPNSFFGTIVSQTFFPGFATGAIRIVGGGGLLSTTNLFDKGSITGQLSGANPKIRLCALVYYPTNGGDPAFFANVGSISSSIPASFFGAPGWQFCSVDVSSEFSSFQTGPLSVTFRANTADNSIFMYVPWFAFVQDTYAGNVTSIGGAMSLTSGVTYLSGSARISGTLTAAALTNVTTTAGATSIIAGGATSTNFTGLQASADTSGQFIMYLNGSARATDGGTLTGTIRNDTGGDLRFVNVAGIGLYVRGSTGFCGINNTAPTVALDVIGNCRLNNCLFSSISSSMLLLNQNQAANAASSFALYQGTAGDTVINTAPGNSLGFKVGSMEYARLSSAGLLGVNTTTPAFTLDVNGSARVARQVIQTFNVTLGSTQNNATNICDLNANSGAYYVRLTVVQSQANNSISKIYEIPVSYNLTSAAWQRCLPLTTSGAFSGNDFDIDINISNVTTVLRLVRTAANGPNSAVACTVQVTDDINNAVSITADSTTTSAATNSGLFAGTRITTYGGSGNVGINTTTPAFNLDVNGSARISGSLNIGSLAVPKVQSGLVNIGNPSSFTFPVPFAGTPIVVVSFVSTAGAYTSSTLPGNGYLISAGIYNVSATGFSAQVIFIANGSAAVRNDGGGLFTWIATGP